jgi:hypothetical protein
MSETEASPASQPPAVPEPTAAPAKLREDEEVALDAHALELVSRHRERLESWVSGVGPALPAGEPQRWRRRTYVVDWKLQISYAGLYIATVTLFLLGFAASNIIILRVIQGIKLNAQVRTQEWWQEGDTGFYIILNLVIILFLV